MSADSFDNWCKQYTSKENFDSLDAHIAARMLLFSLWEHRQDKIAKLQAENKILRKGLPALEDIAEARTCEKINPGFRKYVNHESGWFGVIDYARQAYKEITEELEKLK